MTAGTKQDTLVGACHSSIRNQPHVTGNSPHQYSRMLETRAGHSSTFTGRAAASPRANRLVGPRPQNGQVGSRRGSVS